ncbi:hypothetical protein AAG906_031194 [Vitis piasezkii]
MLRKYEPDTTHVLDWQDLNLQEDVTYEEGPRQILDKKEKVLRTKTIPLVKVLWDHHGVEGATWELESDMRNKYPELFTDPFIRGAAARLHHFTCSKLGLERETRERKCRFEAKIAYLEETQKGSRYSWFCVVEMVYGVIGLQEGYGIITDHIQENLLVAKCLFPKALEEDTPMWVYGSQKTRGMTCPWVMSQNSHYYIDRVSCGALISAVYIVGSRQFIGCEKMDGEKQ